MRRTKTLNLALCTMLALCAIPATAAALELPDIHTALTGETYPIVLSGEARLKEEGNEKEISLQTEASKLPAKTVAVLLVASELTSLGSATIDFTGSHEAGNPTAACSTEGDAAGVVLIPAAEYHVVPISLSPLDIGLLILFPKYTVTCTGGLKIKDEAPLLGLVMFPTPNAAGDIEGITALTHCSAAGIAEVSSFLNDKEEKLTGQLLKVNFGAGAVNGCEEILPPLELKIEKPPSLATMFTILNT
jgi:hypothetical protein